MNGSPLKSPTNLHGQLGKVTRKTVSFFMERMPLSKICKQIIFDCMQGILSADDAGG